MFFYYLQFFLICASTYKMLSALINFPQWAEIWFIAERALSPFNLLNLFWVINYFVGVSGTSYIVQSDSREQDVFQMNSTQPIFNLKRIYWQKTTGQDLPFYVPSVVVKYNVL
jgi:hypothetical protein